MNFLDIVKKVCDEVELSPPVSLTNPSANTRRVMEFVNEAYNEIWLMLHPTNEDGETEVSATLVTSQDYIVIPAAIRDVHMVAASTNPPFRLLPWFEFELNYKRSAEVIYISGYPDVCSIYDGKLYFYPRPDEAYPITIRGTAVFADLSSESDTPLLRVELHRAIKTLAVAFYESYHNNPTYMATREKALEMVRLAKAAQRRHWQRPSRIMHESEFTRRANIFRVRG